MERNSANAFGIKVVDVTSSLPVPPPRDPGNLAPTCEGRTGAVWRQIARPGGEAEAAARKCGAAQHVLLPA